MEDNFIANFPKLDTSDKKVHCNMENPKICAYRSTKIDKTLEKITYESESQKIYASMARMSTSEEINRRDYGYISQLTNWILDSGATCYTTPEISNFIPGSLAETEKYTGVADGHFVTEKKNRRI